mmetsp:Transcript_2581/g.5400  ORF Transcript_2581/g.5400 Transcript_2581/m.5400 type:complete len:302 (-) Transcript_2581:151-1056(-)
MLSALPCALMRPCCKLGLLPCCKLGVLRASLQPLKAPSWWVSRRFAAGARATNVTDVQSRSDHSSVEERSHVAGMVSDMSGDVRSDAALVNHLFSGRLYRLIRECLSAKLATAAWPVWGARLASVRGALDDIIRRAHYRMPKVYRMSVQLVVATTLVTDAFVIGTVVGRVYLGGYPLAHAVAAFATLLLVVLTVPVVLLVTACIEMEEPFGDNLMDVPGLAYVRSAAEVALNVVLPHPRSQAAVSAILEVRLAGGSSNALVHGGAMHQSTSGAGRPGSPAAGSPGSSVGHASAAALSPMEA